MNFDLNGLLIEYYSYFYSTALSLVSFLLLKKPIKKIKNKQKFKKIILILLLIFFEEFLNKTYTF